MMLNLIVILVVLFKTILSGQEPNADFELLALLRRSLDASSKKPESDTF